MSDTELTPALERLEAALAKAENALEAAKARVQAIPPVITQVVGDPDLERRHAELKAEASFAVAAMDKLLGESYG